MQQVTALRRMCDATQSMVMEAVTATRSDLGVLQSEVALMREQLNALLAVLAAGLPEQPLTVLPSARDSGRCERWRRRGGGGSCAQDGSPAHGADCMRAGKK